MKAHFDYRIGGIAADIEVIKNRGCIRTVYGADILIEQSKELLGHIAELEQYEKIDEKGIEKA